jgi:tetratricopeptide (TPR) repeat protein
MARCIRFILLSALILCGSWQAAQAQMTWHERPTIYKSAPLSRHEIDRREALLQFALGLVCEREDRLVEAVQAFEKSARLDATQADVFKALVPFYVALDRPADALNANRKVLELNPTDFEAYYMCARLLKSQGKADEARDILRRGLVVPQIKDQPAAAQPMYFLLGNLLESANDYAGAADAYSKAAAILDHPESIIESLSVKRELLTLRAAELYERIGKMYVQARRFDDAIAAFEQAQKRFPDGAARLNFNLAHVCLERGEHGKALAYVDGYLRLQPQGMEAYELKIKLLQKLGKENEIIPWLEQASRADSFNMGLKLLLAKTYASHSQGQQAETIFVDLVGKAPSAEAYRGLLYAYDQDQRTGKLKALRLLNDTLGKISLDQPVSAQDATRAQALIDAIKDDGDLAKSLVKTAFTAVDGGVDLRFKTVQVLAALADRHRRFVEAERFYRTGLRQATGPSEALLYSGLLRVLWRERKYDSIVELCRQGLNHARFTNLSLFRGELARALARLGQVDQALAEVDRGLQAAADPDRFNFRMLRVRILTMADRFDRAEAECLAMLKEFQKPAETMETRYLLSGVYSAARNLPKAEEQLTLILRADPNNATANNDLGYLWADQNKNLKQAETMIRKAIELDREQRKTSGSTNDKDNAAYVDSLGWVLFRLGQHDAAIRELERAASLPDGEDPTIWEHLGDVYHRLNQFDRARRAWEHALRLYESEKTRKMDHRYQELQRRYRLLEAGR